MLQSDRAALLQRLGCAGLFGASGALRYLDTWGITKYLVVGANAEFGMSGVKAIDLRNLHRLVRELRPANIIEFGCGYSTLAIAHALQMNEIEEGKIGKLYVIEASEAWADNVRKKLQSFEKYVEIRVEKPELITLDGQLCHAFPNLPNIRPDLIYLDGPDVADVRGQYRGLSFEGMGKFACSADPLFYEWFIYPGFKMVVDGRYTNVEFLRHNFRRKFRVTRNWLHDYTLFELIK
jgi:hypothetical protein